VDEGLLYKSFGRRVAGRRSVLMLTQAQLAARVGVSRASIANIERGQQNLSLHQVYRLTLALGLSDVNDLLPRLEAEVPDDDAAVPIREPEGGLSDDARRQVERLYRDVGST
jgi:transcriptional regulator with XRE-family HTH domain